MQPSQWYYVLAQNREQHGPVSDEHLDELIAAGALQPTDYVWKTGMADWARAETAHELAERFVSHQEVVLPPESPPPEMLATEAQEVAERYAGFWRRSAALVIDGLLLAAAWALAAGAFWLLERSQATEEVLPQRALVLTGIGLPLGAVAYYVLLEGTRHHASVGKRVLHLEVTRLDGGPPTFWQVLARNLLKGLIFVLIGLIGFAMSAFTKRKQALHDLVSNTLVVVRPRPSQNRS